MLLRPLGPDRRDTFLFLGRSFAHPRNGKERETHGRRTGVYRYGDCTSESQWEGSDKTGTSRGGRTGQGGPQRPSHQPVRGPGVLASLPFLPSFQEALRTSLRIRRKKRGRRRRRTEPQEEGRKEEAA